MSLIYFPVSEASPSDSNELECGRLPFAKSSLFAKPYYASIGRKFLSMTTSERLPQSDCPRTESGQLTLFAEDFHARTSALPVRARASQVPVQDSGQNTPVLLAKYDRATSSWRTSQLCLDGGLALFSETWPRSGMTQSGIAYQLPMLVPLTCEIERGLWPTVGAQSRGVSGSANTRKLLTLIGAESSCLSVSQSEWLMGYPEGWTALLPSETPSSRKSPKSSAKR